jgi:hypothetical protein
LGNGVTLNSSGLSGTGFTLTTSGISTTSGTIGGWTIDTNRIYKSTGAGSVELSATNRKLTFTGDGQITFNGSGGIYMDAGAGNPGGGIYLFNTNNGIYASRYDNGHVGAIGYSISYAVYGNANTSGYRAGAFEGGDVSCTGNIIAYYSDERLKTKLGNIENALDKIHKLNGFYYTNNDFAKSVGYTDEKIQVGVSAQEVKNILPEVVSIAPFDIDELSKGMKSKSGENYMTVQYDRLVPLLIEAIKELSNKVDELENKLKNK